MEGRSLRREVDSALARARRNFSELLDEDANPLEVALALMDQSSIGKQRHSNEFQQLRADLRDSLKGHVDANYEGFNSSVGIYHAVVDGINESHDRIVHIQTGLNSMRESLGAKRPVLRELHQTSLKYKQMLDLLEVVEELKQVPDKVDEMIAQKQFMAAYSRLSQALETIVNRDLTDNRAIEPIHSYVVSQQMALPKIILEELMAHIYLKSPYTQDKWLDLSTPTREQEALLNTQPGRLLVDGPKRVRVSASEIASKALKTRQPGTARSGMEEDSLLYISTLLESLSKIGQLEQACESLQANTSKELRRLTEKTISDYIKKSGVSLDNLKAVPLDFANNTEPEEYTSRLQMLAGLAVTLYSKFLAVAESHRMVFEVSKTLGVGYDLKILYDSFEGEIRSVLIKYVEEGPSLRPRGRSFSSIESRRSGASRPGLRSELSGPRFQFDGDVLDKEMAEQLDNLKLNVKKWVPGSTISAKEVATVNFTPFADTHKESNLSVVAPPSVRNMRALAQPTSAFFQQVRPMFDIPELSVTMTRMDNFIDEFMTRTYLPRLRQAVEHKFEDIVDSPTGDDIYEDYRDQSQLPLQNFAVQLMEVIYRVCLLINAGSGSSRNFSQLIVHLVGHIQGICQEKIKDTVATARDARVSKQVYSFAQAHPLKNLHRVMRTGGPNAPEAAASEIQFFLAKRFQGTKGRQLISQSDLLEPDNFKNLSLLSTSIRWIAMRLKQLRVAAQAEPDASKNDHGSSKWVMADILVNTDSSELSDVHAVLSGDSLKAFDRYLDSLNELADTAVSVLHSDTFSRTVYYFDQMATMTPNASKADQDSYIDILQRQIIANYQTAKEVLLPSEREFTFAGIARLMNELMILESQNMPKLDQTAFQRMFASIVSLQQALKSIVSSPKDVDFSRSTEFYKSLGGTAARVLDAARNQKTSLTRDDIKLLLDYKHQEDLAKTDRDEALVNMAHQQQLETLGDIFKVRPSGVRT